MPVIVCCSRAVGSSDSYEAKTRTGGQGPAPACPYRTTSPRPRHLQHIHQPNSLKTKNNTAEAVTPFHAMRGAPGLCLSEWEAGMRKAQRTQRSHHAPRFLQRQCRQLSEPGAVRGRRCVHLRISQEWAGGNFPGVVQTFQTPDVLCFCIYTNRVKLLGQK